MLKNIMLGSDPELFIVDKEANRVVSAIGLIPGEKGEPYTEGLPKGYGLEIDNILGEFNIPPCKTKEEWIHHMNFMKDFIRKFIKDKNPNLDIIHKASTHVDEDQLQDPIAKLFGCSVDFNAYTEQPNPKPEGATTNLRSSGCHIHVSYDNPNINKSIKLVKYMDMYLGIPSVILDPDTERRFLYGKAGCFRICDYGLEYRTLSGYFLDNDRLLEFMWDQTMRAIDAFNNHVALIPQNEVCDAINNSDVDKAEELIHVYNLLEK